MKIKTKIKSNIEYIKSLMKIHSCSKTMNARIIFKADDLNGLTENVKKLDRFVLSENICVSWGIIGTSLDNPTDDYIKFVKDRLDSKNYHFFNHGYLHLWKGEYEFYAKNYNEQHEYIKKTQDLFLKNLGTALDSFGAPCNKIDETTLSVLQAFPEIKFWYFGLPNTNKINLKRLADIENGVGKPEFDYFYTNIMKLSIKKDQILVLQIHPNQWTKERFLEFSLCIKLLKKMKCSFVNPDSRFFI